MWLSYLTMILLLVVGLLLIIVVLLQRGRGGGLAGALGGMGGQSAFGTKAGDVFTRITIVIAVIWVVLAGVSGFALRADANRLAERVGGLGGVENEGAEEPPVGRDDDADTKAFTPPEQPRTEKKADVPAQPETKAPEATKAAQENGAVAPTDQKGEPASPDAGTPK